MNPDVTTEREETAVTLHVDDNRIATITVDRPGAKLNTFNQDVLEQLARHITTIKTRAIGGDGGDDGPIAGVLIKSGKAGSFIAGADINLIAGLETESAAQEASAAGQEVFSQLADLPVPTVALIDGVCLGGGLELALSCTYRIATDNSATRLGLPETQLGVLPGWGGTFRLPRTVGIEEAVKMILTGSPADAGKALRIGLVDLVYPAAFLEEWGKAALLEVVARGSHGQIERNRAKAAKRRKKLLEGNPLGRWILFSQARKNVISRTGGHYPAPLTAVNVLARTARGRRRRPEPEHTRKRALQLEHHAFGRLAVTPECTELVRLFFAREAVKHHPVLEGTGKERVIRRAAVLGAGVMGGRIAWLFSKNDIPVVMKDIALDAVHKGYQSAKSVYDVLQKKRKLDAREAMLKLDLIHGTTEYAALGRPDVVVEAVVERMDVKTTVLQELESYISDTAIIATNTSALSVNEMAASLAHPERFVGMHFFNPVNRMPLVEVVRGRKSDDEVVAAVVRLALSLGKTPVVVDDSPGFIVNRLLLPYLNEAAMMLSEGVDIPAVDRIYTDFGMPMGPYTLLDEVGLDVGVHVADTLHAAFGDRMAVAEILEAIRGTATLLGKKGGAGFYRYTGSRQGDLNPEMVRLVANHRSHVGSGASGPGKGSLLTDEDILDRGMLNMVNEAARVLEEKIVSGPQELDLAMIMGTGFPPFRGGLLRWADSRGIAGIRDRLNELSERYGERFTPAPLVEELADKGGSFYR